ncbi:MAG: imidazole glycerol phosphate synthase subunit HisH [Rhodothermia bacterium]
MSVAVLKYNAGNVRSVSIALTRLGVEHEITDDHDRIRSASHFILPGVGEASSAMRYLSDRDLTDLIAGLTQPVLGICLGLQLFCRYSEENDTECLGIFPETVRLFKKARKVPHIGWNEVERRTSDVGRPHVYHTVQPDYFYFVHSYYAEIGPSTAGVTKYGEQFASVMQHENFLATQFHPEKSADAGYRLLRSFLGLKTTGSGPLTPTMDLGTRNPELGTPTSPGQARNAEQ